MQFSPILKGNLCKRCPWTMVHLKREPDGKAISSSTWQPLVHRLVSVTFGSSQLWPGNTEVQLLLSVTSLSWLLLVCLCSCLSSPSDRRHNLVPSLLWDLSTLNLLVSVLPHPTPVSSLAYFTLSCSHFVSCTWVKLEPLPPGKSNIWIDLYLAKLPRSIRATQLNYISTWTKLP